MSIVSYLAYPVDGYRDQLIADLQQHPHCEVVLSDNSDVFILVTDTQTAEEEKQTQEFLQGHKGLLCMAMVYGQLDEPSDEPLDKPSDEPSEFADSTGQHKIEDTVQMATGDIQSEER